MPKKCDIRLDLESDIDFESNSGLSKNIDSYLNEHLSDLLSDEYDFCVNGVSYSWEYDFDDVKKLFMKLAKKEYKKYCKTNEYPADFDFWI